MISTLATSPALTGVTAQLFTSAGVTLVVAGVVMVIGGYIRDVKHDGPLSGRLRQAVSAPRVRAGLIGAGAGLFMANINLIIGAVKIITSVDMSRGWGVIIIFG